MAIIDDIPDFEVIGQAMDGFEAVQFIFDFNPDVTLLGLMTSEMDGNQVIRYVISRRPRERILVISGFTSNELVLQAIRLGALGYLFKDCSRAELEKAIRDIYQWVPYLQSGLFQRLITYVESTRDIQEKYDQLTRQEKVVVTLVAEGLTNEKIAEKLGLSRRTIEVHVSHALKKLVLSNRTQLAIFVMKKKWFL